MQAVSSLMPLNSRPEESNGLFLRRRALFSQGGPIDIHLPSWKKSKSDSIGLFGLRRIP